MKIVVDYFW